MNQKPYAPAAEKNRHDILTVLKNELPAAGRVLELASGTGQHACHFAHALPAINWQPSELAENLSGIEFWIEESDCANISSPLAIDIGKPEWPDVSADVCYAANTLHIVSLETVDSLFAGCARVLGPAGKLIVYGPFMVDGQHTAPSNQRFDLGLRARNPQSGLRDIGMLDQLAVKYGFSVARLIEMPVNNLVAIWEKVSEK